MAIEIHTNSQGGVKALAVDGVWLRRLGTSVFEARNDQIEHVALSELPNEVEIVVKNAGYVNTIASIDGTEATVVCNWCICNTCVQASPIGYSKRFNAIESLVNKATAGNPDINAGGICESKSVSALEITLSVKGSTCGDVIRRVEDFFVPIQKRMKDLEAEVDAFIDKSLTS
jgi:hypothetical protein